MKIFKNKLSFIEIILLIFLIIFSLLIIFIMSLGITTSKDNLSKCAKKLGLIVTWNNWLSSINYPVHTEGTNETTIFCCYNNPVLNSEGALIHKCYFVDR